MYLIAGSLRTKFRAIHVQTVSIGTRICRSRPPVAVRVPSTQTTINPGIVARVYIRKRIPAGFGRAGGAVHCKEWETKFFERRSFE